MGVALTFGVLKEKPAQFALRVMGGLGQRDLAQELACVAICDGPPAKTKQGPARYICRQKVPCGTFGKGTVHITCACAAHQRIERMDMIQRHLCQKQAVAC